MLEKLRRFATGSPNKHLRSEQELRPPSQLGERVDRLEQAFESELTHSMSLNIRATALGAAAVLVVLLLAIFSAVWLDDARWIFNGTLLTIQKFLLGISVLATGVCLLLAVLVARPRSQSARAIRDRVGALSEGAVQQEAELLLHMLESQRAANEGKAHKLRAAAPWLLAAAVATFGQAAIFAIDADTHTAQRVGEASAPPVREITGLPPEEVQQDLAERYAPRVVLHPDEIYRPLDPQAFIEGSRLIWRESRGHLITVRPRGGVEAASLGESCLTAPAGCLDYRGYLARELTRPSNKSPERPGGLPGARGLALDPADSLRRGDPSGGLGIPTFYEFRATPDELLLTFWFFYAYSRPHIVAKSDEADRRLRRISHEGDWENIDLALAPLAESKDAEDPEPLAVYFYAHGREPDRWDWSDLCKLVADSSEPDCQTYDRGRPIVYSAQDSHASFPTANRTRACLLRICWDDVRADGAILDTWRSPAGVLAAQKQPWYGFGGGWGTPGQVVGGPLGPSRWKLAADPDPGPRPPLKVLGSEDD